MKNYIGISRDHSGSMRSLARSAARDYNSTVEAIRTAAIDQKQDTIVSVVKCGVGATGAVKREAVFSSITVLGAIADRDYDADGSSTPLWDSVGDLIEQFESAPDASDPEVSFVVMAITDGEENSSRKYNARTLGQKMQQLQATDRWTFVFRVPRGYAHKLVQLGIPRGNVLEWDQTESGMTLSTQATTEAFTKYYSDRTMGVKSAKSFYTTDLTGVSAKTVAAKLVDISSDVVFGTVTQDTPIRPFVENVLGRQMKKGAAFYQLTKREDEVQDYKVICIRDKKSGHVYSGLEARNILGLPHHGTVPVAPGNHGAYDIFIQSTSVNRRLVAGTQLLYWEKVGQPYQAPAAAPVAKTPPPVVKPIKVSPGANVITPAHGSEYIAGYKVGFVDGKSHAMSSRRGSIAFNDGYDAGYKDGRGKKKRIYK